MSKYQSVRKMDGTIVNEPTAILRAQDRYAPMALALYIKTMEDDAKYASDGSYSQELKQVLFEMITWQAKNPDKVKNPD